MTTYQNDVISMFLKNDNDYLQLNDKLFIGITTHTGHKYISRFESNDHLRHVLHCSFYIPFYSTYIPKYENELVIDGSIGFHYKTLSRDTIIIGAGGNKDYDICGNLSLYECTFPIIAKYNDVLNSGYTLTRKYLENLEEFQPKFMNLNL